MILTPQQMRDAEERAFKSGSTAEDLMEEVGDLMAQAIRRFNPAPGFCVVYAGKGNNAGDAFVAARHLQASGWQIGLRLAYPEKDLGKLPAARLAALQEQGGIRILSGAEVLYAPGVPIIALDGLLGLAGEGQLREPILGLCQEINEARRQRHIRVYALDVPSGLNPDSGYSVDHCVMADFTLTVAHAKRGLLTDNATAYTGRLVVLPIPALEIRAGSVEGLIKDEVLTSDWLAGWLPHRGFNTHKGDCGRIGIVAGSRRFPGAARLAAEGALRAGAGLVTLFVTDEIHPILAAACPPEVMVRPVKDYAKALDEALDVLAVGPGLDPAAGQQILELIEKWDKPMVVDAEALNLVSKELHLLDICPGPRLLTPHPGEMKRLMPDMPRLRIDAARAFTEQYPVTLLLKGSRTVIAEQGEPSLYNITGSPGMATGGMGDILTGVTAALAGAPEMGLRQAAALGAWLCGRAAELALSDPLTARSEESLLPTDVLANLGSAFQELRFQSF